MKAKATLGSRKEAPDLPATLAPPLKDTRLHHPGRDAKALEALAVALKIELSDGGWHGTILQANPLPRFVHLPYSPAIAQGTVITDANDSMMSELADTLEKLCAAEGGVC